MSEAIQITAAPPGYEAEIRERIDRGPSAGGSMLYTFIPVIAWVVLDDGSLSAGVIYAGRVRTILELETEGYAIWVVTSAQADARRSKLVAEDVSWRMPRAGAGRDARSADGV